MNLATSWGEVARTLSGRLLRGSPEDPFSSLSTDTRRLKKGEAFWALRGNRTDGHEFLACTTDAGGWVVERGRPMPSLTPAHLLDVPDTLKGLHALAAHHRRRFDIPVAAITGSNGKTSTKDMLRSICQQQGPVCATPGNLNNQFGLPLSVLELGREHRYGVFELGASRLGDISDLARIAQPTVGVLTNIAQAHLEFFGTLETVFKTKTELLAAIPPEGKVAINLDDPWLANLETHLGARAITYGRNERAAVRLMEEGNEIALVIHRQKVPIQLSTLGWIHHLNAAAAAAGAIGLGLGPEQIAGGLKEFRPAPLRFEIRSHPSGATLVVDAYNANPGSMKTGIESFLKAFQASRCILVLGDMKELGPESGRLHRELGEWLLNHKLAAVYLAGQAMAQAAEALRVAGANMEITHSEDPTSCLVKLRQTLDSNTAVYFKASRAMAFEKLADSL